MASADSAVLVHWNGSMITKDNEIEYSIPPKVVLFISKGDDFNTLYEGVLKHIREAGFSEIQSIYGKMPKFKNSVYAASRAWPIHDDRSWSNFSRVAIQEYEELQIFVDVINNSIAPPQNLICDEGLANTTAAFGDIGQGPSSTYGRRRNTSTFQGFQSPVTNLSEDSDDPDFEQHSSDVESSSSSDNDEAVDMTWATLEIDEPYVEAVNRDSEMIAVGVTFKSYDELKEVVARANIRQHSFFRSDDKRPRSWKAVCIYPANKCSWHIQAGADRNSHVWKVKKYQPIHTCLPDYFLVEDDGILTSKLIASEIGPKVSADPDYKIKLIILDIYEKFKIHVSYKKDWYGRLIALERKFGNWEASYNQVPKLFQAIRYANPGSLVQIQSQPIETNETYEFCRAFWSFKASIDGFCHCLPVVSVDGTHLYGKFKGVLLVAVTMNANREIFPLAYGVVESENANSWSWFLQSVMEGVVGRDRPVCIISDRHAGIESAFRNVPELLLSQVSKRYCLCHIQSNFMTKFRNTELKKLCWQAGSTPIRNEFHDYMQQIRGINASAFAYLNEIDVERWTLSYDDGWRYSILTTNLSESFNHILKGCRTLPITALIKATFDKVVQLFPDQRNTGAMWHQAGYLYPQNIWKELLERSQQRHLSTVLPHNRRAGIYSVTIRKHQPVTVNLSRRECDCGYWKQNGMPCVHAYAICHFLRITADQLIPEVYTLNAYIQTYATDIMPIQDLNDFPDNQYIILPPKNRRSVQLGRSQRTRFQNEMDLRPRRRGQE
ncbi:unnamed protein product [Cuscuta europaea]|uniref:SWIM-type domain-containing protein n=1 Tax=Cuscuta europaea TaxID=41803 RepID=A0A9P1EGB1_CUSEU|nr:unnamed protein product [Cuscuta europaea]